MVVVSPEQMNEIDRTCIESLGIPGTLLMESAAIRVVDEILKELGSTGEVRVTIIAGKGNNGGDAFAAARHLWSKGIELRVYITAHKECVTGDAKINLDILGRLGIGVIELTEEDQLAQFKANLIDSTLIVDGVLGTGIKRDISTNLKKIFDTVNASGKRIISIDIPSGICGETGKVLGGCIKAWKTVTFALPKTGLLIHPGCEYTGKLVIADIGIPDIAIKSIKIDNNLLEEDFVRRLIPKRYEDSNKGGYGKVFVIGGSAGMAGAACLAAKAALRCGVGLVYLGAPASMLQTFQTAVTEAVTVPLVDNKGLLVKSSISEIISQIKGKDVIAIGPGLSQGEDILDIVSAVIESSHIPLVIDADAINAAAKDIAVLKKLKAKAVITPHPGEMARLLGISTKEVQERRLECAREFAMEWGITTVLKGSRTVIALPDGNLYINTTGNSGMATGGSGDVLTGVISSFIGQGLSPENAALAGVYLHGLAGDSVAKIRGEHGLIAGDIVEELPNIINILK